MISPGLRPRLASSGLSRGNVDTSMAKPLRPDVAIFGISHISRLPVEIVEHIIGCFIDDVSTLQACALVCRLWLELARSHLFYKVALQPSPQHRFIRARRTPNIQRALELMSPEIATHVREVSLEEGGGQNEWMKSETVLPSLLTLFGHAQHLRLGRTCTAQIVWADLPPDLVASIRSLLVLPTMVTVTLEGLFFDSPAQLRWLLESCHAIRRLSVGDVYFRNVEDSEGEAGLVRAVVPLDSLVIGPMTSPALLPALLHGESRISLTDLRRLDVIISNDFVGAGRLLERAQRVEYLKLDIMSKDPVLSSEGESGLRLLQKPALRTLVIKVITYFQDPFFWLDALLSSIEGDSAVETVHIICTRYIALSSTTIFAGWKSVDRTLTGPKYPLLTHVKLSLKHSVCHPSLPKSVSWAGAKLPSPNLRARGVLKVEVV